MLVCLRFPGEDILLSKLLVVSYLFARRRPLVSRFLSYVPLCGEVPLELFYAVGGTVSTLCPCVAHEMKPNCC